MAMKSLEDNPCSVGHATLSQIQEGLLCDFHLLVDRQLQNKSELELKTCNIWQNILQVILMQDPVHR
jgi:hypothetical protein